MWVQLPTLTSGGKSVWFSPVFRIIASNAKVPALPKGGFLCEEMGLGKTVEVLALVLANPAPKDFVAKGDAKGSVMSSPSEGFTDGTELPNSADRERVKYRSKATLVVCAVSLVGQWIDEARSKLSKGADGKEQLSIHMYHGQKRIRDAKLLAEEFDLIVTTYQTLASDRGKLGVNHPLSQIEFYRIVLDEAHMAKSGSTASERASSFVRRGDGRARERPWAQTSAISTASCASWECTQRLAARSSTIGSGRRLRAGRGTGRCAHRRSRSRRCWRSPCATPRTR